MTRLVVLDTTFLIALERAEKAAQALYERLLDEGAAMRVPAAVWVEYLAPMDAATRRKARSTLEDSVIFEPFSREAADEAADLQHELLAVGRRLGWHDLQVAATARLHREPLVTRDDALQGLPGIETVAH